MLTLVGVHLAPVREALRLAAGHENAPERVCTPRGDHFVRSEAHQYLTGQVTRSVRSSAAEPLLTSAT